MSGPYCDGEPTDLPEHLVKDYQNRLIEHGDDSLTGVCSICGVHRCGEYRWAELRLMLAGAASAS